MKHFNPKQLAEHIENSQNDFLLLDVRELWEYEICHIENSVLIPMQQIPTELENLDKNQEIVVICHHGVRSRHVGVYMEHNGFSNVINLDGGVAAWAQEVDIHMPQY